MKHHAKKRLPIPGQRLIRSLLAVLLCFAIYDLRGHQGLPFYSVIAALQCVQQYTRSMKAVARRRVIGTLIGAAGGLSVVLLELWIARRNPADSMVHYLIIGLATILVMYFTVVLKIADMAYFSAVVFLSIAINHIGDLNPFLYVFHRSLDTIIGVLVAELVNRIHFPRLRHTDTLFVSRIHDTLFETGEALSDYARIELNRLIDDGCLFTISTIQTPASVRELLPGVRLKLPIIAMDGTVLYDTEKREYLETVAMDPKKLPSCVPF